MRILWLFAIFVAFVTSLAIGLPTDILPPHPPGVFLTLTSIGFSAGVFEISTAPIYDLLGIYNSNLRIFLGKSSVVNFALTIYDPQIYLFYMGEGYPNSGFYLWTSGGYFHNNMFFGRFVLKNHLEFADWGILVRDNGAISYLHTMLTRLYEQLGYFPLDFIELFSGIEAGVSLGVFTSEDIDDAEFDLEAFNQQLREKSLYSVWRIGARWYYGDFVLEIGYRNWFIESPLGVIQGYTFADLAYNIIHFFTYSQENVLDVNIPFVTTDYYLTISAKF